MLVDAGIGNDVIDVLGLTLEFLTSNDDYCVTRGVVPRDVTVPLNSHADPEDFFILSGTQQVLIETDQGNVGQEPVAGTAVGSAPTTRIRQRWTTVVSPRRHARWRLARCGSAC